MKELTDALNVWWNDFLRRDGKFLINVSVSVKPIKAYKTYRLVLYFNRNRKNTIVFDTEATGRITTDTEEKNMNRYLYSKTVEFLLNNAEILRKEDGIQQISVNS